MTNETTILAALNRGDVKAAQRYLTENIREEAAKKSGAKSSEIAIMKRIAREYEKRRNSEFQVQKVKFEDRIYYMLCDGVKLFLSENSYGYEIADHELLNLKRTIPHWKEWTCRTLDREKAAVVKAENKINKNDKKSVIYEFSDGLPLGINPEYLLDAMDFTGTTEAWVNPAPRQRWGNAEPVKCVVDPVILHNPENHRFALVCPVNIQNYITRKAA
ncbi:MAG: hypothetical protein LUD47_03075 [Clostridia bacterium]|nr:hypothetical protein [Clostridia bacterium]